MGVQKQWTKKETEVTVIPGESTEAEEYSVHSTNMCSVHSISK